MTDTVINLRAAAKQELVTWFKDKVIDPAIEELRAEGLSDEEINIALNSELFYAFRGLHRFDL